MKLCKVSDLFDVKYGTNLELNKLTQIPNGINFVSRTEKNNGVSAKVEMIPEIEPAPAGTITVAGSGSVMASFLQKEPFYSGFHLFYLTPKKEFNTKELLFYCLCLRKNKFRFNFGRQVNRTLPDLLIPVPEEIPAWVYETEIPKIDFTKSIADEPIPVLNTEEWEEFKLENLFDFENGKGSPVEEENGTVPIITSSTENNGVSGYTSENENTKAGPAITISIRGGGNAFYQEGLFCPSLNALVLHPKFDLTKKVGLFICTILNLGCFKYSYGRIRTLGRVKEEIIKLPTTPEGNPDWQFMEEYMKRVPGSGFLK